MNANDGSKERAWSAVEIVQPDEGIPILCSGASCLNQAAIFVYAIQEEPKLPLHYVGFFFCLDCGQRLLLEGVCP